MTTPVTTITFPNGTKILVPAHPEPCTSVQVIRSDGTEIAYWDENEWKEAPAEVMGALMGLIAETLSQDFKFTLFWRDGKREIVTGNNIADAMSKRGYGHGTSRALDFFAVGDNQRYQWTGTQWERKRR